MNQRRKFKVGQRVLANVLPHPGHVTEAYLPGVISEYHGKMDIYDGRVSQDKVDFPVVQHAYQIELEECGSVMNFQCRILPDHRFRKAS